MTENNNDPIVTTTTTTTSTTPISFPLTYHNLILSSFPLKMINSKVLPPNNCTTKMESISLEPIEDAFLELGGMGGNVDPDAIAKVKNWESNVQWDDRHECDCKLISIQNDVAFVEFMVHTAAAAAEKLHTTKENADDDNGHYLSTPLILEIEIGNGSWDSSLIQGTEGNGTEKEYVPFVVLPTWKQS